jgi:rhamnosyltransferase
VSSEIVASIVIRTLNEADWLPQVFEELKRQAGRYSHEVVLVDSGSTDGTVEIARSYGARVVFIKKEDFSFGRSLNVGCDAALGKVLVFVSGHCIPVGEHWLDNLIAPLIEGKCSYSYGRQVGHARTKFSEQQLFEKFYPGTSSISRTNFFCNNANSALLRSVWETNQFDEALTGLEDMELGKRLVSVGHSIGYVADAPVIHIHEETWRRVRIRYEREAIALQHIMPEVHVSMLDATRWFVSGVIHDCGVALRDGKLVRNCAKSSCSGRCNISARTRATSITAKSRACAARNISIPNRWPQRTIFRCLIPYRRAHPDWMSTPRLKPPREHSPPAHSRPLSHEGA